MEKNYMTRKDYDRWYKTLRIGIETILNEYGVKYEYEDDGNPEYHKYYIIKDIPNIGGYRIGLQPFESAKKYGGRGVEFFSIFSRFDTFTDPLKLLPYQERANHYSGKYNFHCTFGHEENLIDTYLYVLKEILNLGEVLK